jgi:hypothetical protein
MTRTFDRWFAAGYAFWVAVFIGSVELSLTDAWSRLASVILKL